MKRLLLFLSILCIAGVIVFFIENQKSIQKSKVLNSSTSVSTPTPSPVDIKQSVVINVDDIPTRISWIMVNPEKIELYSNLKDQKLSEEIKVDKSCSVLVNGGFYSKENTHLGLFLTNFITISPEITSPLLNGFLWIHDNNVFIASNSPNIIPRIAIQSGPLLFLNDKPLTLAINNDEPNRRIVAAKISDDKLLFLAFYRDLAEYEGPLLGQLPEIIKLFQEKTNIKITDAINLDGGSASVFISNYVRLNELAHIGSYFCVNDF
jgi:uncharacterized protein YigE (DUF2233 family)